MKKEELNKEAYLNVIESVFNVVMGKFEKQYPTKKIKQKKLEVDFVKVMATELSVDEGELVKEFLSAESPLPETKEQSA